ncbi:MAG: hypothetical protein NT076_03685, partial [Candidatus Pacearchaeota archaeon]|nr:hypothetical protein [Candidatus Pacearchaeota archaeon]
IENILFWILIVLIVGIAIWKLISSPTDTAALISIALFVAGSEVLIWKSLFGIDKRTCLGFEKFKNDLNSKFAKLDSKIEGIDTKLDSLKSRK